MVCVKTGLISTACTDSILLRLCMKKKKKKFKIVSLLFYSMNLSEMSMDNLNKTCALVLEGGILPIALSLTRVIHLNRRVSELINISKKESVKSRDDTFFSPRPKQINVSILRFLHISEEE